jgi:hypothetical protein
MVISRKLLVLSTIGLTFALTLCETAQAQRGQRGQQGGGAFGGGGPGGPGGPGGFAGGMRGGMGGGPLDLLQREDVQKELRMTAAQIKELASLAQDSRSGLGEQLRERMGDFRDMSEEERREMFAELQETRQKQQEELREKAKTILNRNQQPRFAELEFQFALQRGNLSEALSAAGVEVESDEAEKLQEAQQEAQADIRAKMAQLQLEANMAALESVMDRAKIERLAGEPFTFEAAGGPGAFGRRGGGDPQTRGRRPEAEQRPGRGAESEGRPAPRSRR